MESTLHDIVQGLTIARVHADFMAEQHPQHAKTFRNFNNELLRLQKNLVEIVRPGLYESAEENS